MRTGTSSRLSQYVRMEVFWNAEYVYKQPNLFESIMIRNDTGMDNGMDKLPQQKLLESTVFNHQIGINHEYHNETNLGKSALYVQNKQALAQ